MKQLFFILKRFLAKFVSDYRLFRSQYNWRICNKHNETTAGNIFPIKLVKVGNYTYGPLNVYSWGSFGEFLRIGHFCSIAPGVKFILGGNHKINYLSSFPFKYYFNNKKLEAYSNGEIIINDDVWIGSDVTILSGVRIQQGCVIAAGSVVTKSFPAYTVIGGVPATIIGSRFEKHLVDMLDQIDYSKFNHKSIATNFDLFYEDISKLSSDQIRSYVENVKIVNDSK